MTASAPQNDDLVLPVTRFRFVSQSIRTTAPTAINFPSPRRPGEPPSIIQNGALHYAITASTLRGKWRRWGFRNLFSKLQKVNPEGFTMTSADVRSLILGGVKGSGKMEYLSPAKAVALRKRRPDVEVFGINDPTFFGGCLAVGLMTSVDPAPSAVDPSSTLMIVRRALDTDPILRDMAGMISDIDSLNSYREANRIRSQLTDAIDRAKRLTRKSAISEREAKERDSLLQLLAELTGNHTCTIQEAESYLNDFRKTMRDGGQSDVSEANIQSVSPIPAGTEMRQTMYLNWVSDLGAGYFLNAWNAATMFDPVVGGLAARGAGGYIRASYRVDRQELDGSWTEDCSLTVVPDEGIRFHGSNTELNASKARHCFELWRDLDVTDYDFTFEGLKTFISGKP